ncbi:SDR family NAD(P)-dependent oxidoreductase [Leifsonia poae]|uniref:SDR family NAD(P)-dependent oxidoreductase n=1 Tax=Leifsonia poae TaxID=110933 RepID=UPI003D69B72C
MTAGSLEGRVAIVTGGGRGLGRAMTYGLARAGAHVVISAARQPEEIQAVADDINAALGAQRVLAMQADVTREGTAGAWSWTLSPRSGASTSWSTRPGAA